MRSRLVRRVKQSLDPLYVAHSNLAEALEPVYASQTDLAHTLDELRRSHEQALAGLREAQEACEELHKARAAMAEDLAALNREVYGSLGSRRHEDDRSLIAALADAQRVLLNTVSEGSPAVQRMADLTPAPVAVVIPTCDRPATLDRALHSVCLQTRPPGRVVVVNDGRAPVEDAVEAHRDHLPSIELIRTHQPYSGGSVARNTALDRLDDEHVVYLDDDNVLWPTWVQTASGALERPTGPGAVYGAQLRSDLAAHAGLLYRPFDARALARDNFIDTSSLAHRATSARWNTDLRRLADWDFALALCAIAEVVSIPRLASVYNDEVSGRVSEAPGFRLYREAVRVRHCYAGPAHTCAVCGHDVEAWQEGACPVCGARDWERAAALVIPYLWEVGVAPVPAEDSPVLTALCERHAGIPAESPVVEIAPAAEGFDVPALLPPALVRRLGPRALRLDQSSGDGLAGALSRFARDADGLRDYLRSDELADVLPPAPGHKASD